MITLCSVSFKSEPFLALNRSFVQERNPESSVEWFVVDNTPGGEKALHHHGFKVLPGVAETPETFAPASFHHARALNTILSKVKTRFALILDPDFYILQENWIANVTSYMKEQELAFFGAPWNPRWVRKARYIPCAHCLFIDCERVNLKALNFEPAEENQGRKIRKPSKNVLTLFLDALLHYSIRREIGSVPDVGALLQKNFQHSSYECLTPLFRIPEDVPRGLRPFTKSDLLMEKLLPEAWSLIPKQRSFFTEKLFSEHGVLDACTEGWEEFSWQGKPFGFHVRAFPKREEDLGTVAKRVRSLLSLEEERRAS